MSCGAAGSRSTASAAGPVPSGLAVQHLGKWSAASQLLSPGTGRWSDYGKDLPNQARQAQLSLSHVIVATYHDEALRPTSLAPQACEWLTNSGLTRMLRAASRPSSGARRRRRRATPQLEFSQHAAGISDLEIQLSDLAASLGGS